MPDLAPIALFVYNRPHHTRRTLAALAANPLASESDLIIYADGPKHPGHKTNVALVRKLVRAVEGFKSVRVVQRDANMGLARSIISGVSEVSDARGKVIVLEDDLVVAPQFLSFMNAGLDRYQLQGDVYQISGYLFPGCEGDGRARFLPLTTTWGWATWQRAWIEFDGEASGIARLRADPEFRAGFDLNGAYDYSGMVEQQRRGTIDSWGIRWYLSVFAKNGLTLYPGRSLVENIGFDGSGTHGAGHAQLRGEHSDDQAVVDFCELPGSVTIDHVCIKAIENTLRSLNARGSQGKTIRRLRSWLQK